MIAREVPVRVSLPSSKTPRSKGIHVSAIIRCIAAETGILKAEWVEDLSLVDVREITDQTAVLRMMIGLAFEQFYLPELAEMGVLDHPGEMCVEGIYMTHDGESVSVVASSGNGCNHYAPVVHEVKATYKSTRTVGDMTNQWMWMSQCKAYCKGKGTRFAMMHVLFLCGDYTYPIKPLLKCWEIEFSQEEVDENWSLIKSYLEYRNAQLEETA